MNEYNRAQGSRHPRSTPKRVMEVENQPNSWLPSAILLLLLIICLAAPRFWQRDVATSYSRGDFAGPSPFGHGESTANQIVLPKSSTDFSSYNHGLGPLTTTTPAAANPYSIN